MHESIVGLLEKAELAIGATRGVLGEEDLAGLAATVNNIRARLSYPDDMLIVALAGGTGSGKSSLANAICGSDLAPVGGARPTTGHPVAVLPARRKDAIKTYIDTLGITERHEHDIADWLCLIDLPDTDSVEIDHRLQVEALLPRLDLVVWVVDPEKYRDRALHHRYLAPLAAYSGQFLFVLNQIDRLGGDEVDAVVADLESALRDDGIESPRVMLAAADPPAGPPSGIDELAATLTRVRSEPSGIYDKLLIDLAEATSHLLDETGGGGSLDFDERSAECVEEAAAILVEGGAGAVGRAVQCLTAFLESIASSVSPSSRPEVRRVIADVPLHVQRIDSELSPAPTPPLPKSGLFGRRRERSEIVESEATARVEEALTEAVMRPTRVVLARRAVANGALADLALSVEEIRAKTGS